MAKKKLPKATHEGTLNIGDFKIKAYNLSTGERVLSRIDFLKAIGRTGKAKGGRKYDEEFNLPVFLTANNLKPFIGKELARNSAAIDFIDKYGKESIGYTAQLLPSVCYVFIDANKAEKLHKNQLHIVERSEVLVRGFATVGIIALIDEATGYQYEREGEELQKILKAYISDELLPWQHRFPHEFYKEIFRLRGWNYTARNIKSKPSVVGHWTNKLIYQQLPKGILGELKKQTPKSGKGKRKHQFHRLLTPDIGHPHLQKQLVSVITLMNVAENWKEFIKLFNKKFGQQVIPFGEVEDTTKVPIENTTNFDEKLITALKYNPKEKG